MWRAGFGRGFGPVVRQTAKWMNELGSHSSIIKFSNFSGTDTVSIGTDLSKDRAAFIFRVTRNTKGVQASIHE